MVEAIFVEFNPITKNEDTFGWVSYLCNEYFQEIRDRGGQVKIVSEIYNEWGEGYEFLILEIKEEDAYKKFKEREGRQRVRIPVFDKKDLTKVITNQTLVLDIKVYSEAPNDFELDKKEVEYKYINTQEGRHQRVAHETYYAQLTHKPTKIIVTCGEERSQVTNKEMAERILRAKLYQMEKNK